MSSPIYIPSSAGFNNNPLSTTVRTASYTIPAGRYARVVANLEGSATLTINGTTALRGTQNSILSSSGLITQTQIINAGFGGVSTNFSGQVLMTGAGVNNGGTNNFGSAAFTSGTDQKTVVQEFWCPTGTVINGTGTWRAIVTEYNT